MSARVNLVNASVLPFQFPAIGGDDIEPPPPVVDPPPNDEDVEPVPLPPSPDPAELAAEAIAAELEKAREEGFERGRAEGQEQGYAAGYPEGLKAGEAKMMEAVKQMAAMVAKLGMPLAALDQPVEEAVVALALEVARCVIGDEVKRSREFLVGLVREAIAKVPLDMGAPRILLNPADLELVRRLAPEIDEGNAVLVDDETIEPGGALIVADGENRQIKDRRWNPRTADGVSQVNLTLSARWRAVMLTLFDGEEGG
jgi:flagellar assembly protein FliH